MSDDHRRTVEYWHQCSPSWRKPYRGIWTNLALALLARLTGYRCDLHPLWQYSWWLNRRGDLPGPRVKVIFCCRCWQQRTLAVTGRAIVACHATLDLPLIERRTLRQLRNALTFQIYEELHRKRECPKAAVKPATASHSDNAWNQLLAALSYRRDAKPECLRWRQWQ